MEQIATRHLKPNQHLIGEEAPSYFMGQNQVSARLRGIGRPVHYHQLTCPLWQDAPPPHFSILPPPSCT